MSLVAGRTLSHRGRHRHLEFGRIKMRSAQRKIAARNTRAESEFAMLRNVEE